MFKERQKTLRTEEMKREEEKKKEEKIGVVTVLDKEESPHI